MSSRLGLALCPMAFALLLVGAAPCLADDKGPRDAGVAPGEDEVAPDSPRAAFADFAALVRDRRFDEAAAYLELPRTDQARGPELARRLKAVLDTRAWVDVDALSPLASGDTGDGLPGLTEDIARIPGANGHDDPVRMVRRGRAEHWVFSRTTVQRIDAWYDGLPHRWVLEHLPPALLRSGPKELLVWQWLALPALLALAWLSGALLARATRFLLVRIARRTRVEWDDALLTRLGGPFTLFWGLALGYLGLPWLGLYAPAEDFVVRLLRGLFLAGLFWTLSRGVDVAARLLAVSPWAVEHRASNSLVPLGARVAKIAVLALGVVAMLSEIGYSVSSLLAGLGIGGLAVALAAQKTVENLFGAFSIGADQPFRAGDFVKIEDFVGTVERVGLRSTRIRTLDRTIITLPNGKLADMRIENFAVRDRMRLACTLGLVYATTGAQLKQVIAGLERTLRQHPKIWPDSITVRFTGFGESSLNVDVMAWFVTTSWDEFQVYREEALLAFMDVVAQAGTSLAFPTRTVQLAPPSADRPRAEGDGAGHASEA